MSFGSRWWLTYSVVKVWGCLFVVCVHGFEISTLKNILRLRNLICKSRNTATSKSKHLRDVLVLLSGQLKTSADKNWSAWRDTSWDEHVSFEICVNWPFNSFSDPTPREGVLGFVQPTQRDVLVFQSVFRCFWNDWSVCFMALQATVDPSHVHTHTHTHTHSL